MVSLQCSHIKVPFWRKTILVKYFYNILFNSSKYKAYEMLKENQFKLFQGYTHVVKYVTSLRIACLEAALHLFSELWLSCNWAYHKINNNNG